MGFKKKTHLKRLKSKEAKARTRKGITGRRGGTLVKGSDEGVSQGRT